MSTCQSLIKLKTIYTNEIRKNEKPEKEPDFKYGINRLLINLKTSYFGRFCYKKGRDK
jgi:hypothetical protein